MTHHMMSHVAMGMLSMALYLSLAHLQPLSLPNFYFCFKFNLSSFPLHKQTTKRYTHMHMELTLRAITQIIRAEDVCVSPPGFKE